MDTVRTTRPQRTREQARALRCLAAIDLTCLEETAERAQLKVILETGELREAETIRTAALLALHAGADFLKTSTGKVAVNATLPAARILLETIRAQRTACGFKAAGGIRDVAT